MVGVARPGIAPIHPGQAPEQAQRPIEERGLADPFADGEAGSRGPSRAPLIALASLALAAVAVLAAALMYSFRGSEVLEAKVSLTDRGAEQLELTCAQCPDGAKVELNGAHARFENTRAMLPLKEPLRIGDNQLTLLLTRPGDETGEPLELNVPVEFRVRGELAPLSETPPKVAVVVESQPGAKLVVNGQAVKLDERGRGRREIDVTRELTTSAPRLKKTIEYALTPPDEKPNRGEVTFETPIAPLAVAAPGRRIVIDEANFMLAGQTTKGGKVSVAGRAITVDANGRFAQLMNVSSEGQTSVTIRADAERHAPRLFPIDIRRVKSLHQEAARLKKARSNKDGDSSYMKLAKKPEQYRGTRVLFDAKVVESRVEGHTTVLLADVQNTCERATCLAKVVYGSKLEVKPGRPVVISGTLAGTVDGPRSGLDILEIHAEFVVKARP